jgi:Starch-binding associating with outer membrane
MKKILYSTIAIAFLWVMPSCNFINEEVNIDPNNPVDVSMKDILPAAAVPLAYNVGGDVGRYLSLWTQHHMGFDRQHLSFDVYQLTESDINAAYDNFYTTILSNLDIVRRKAGETGAPHYAGVAKTLTAYTVALMVDLWDDIPFSNALKGEESLQPTFDKGSELYPKMIALCDEAIADLGQARSNFSPATDDVIYGGNRPKWIAFARSLKARLQLHLSKIDANAYKSVLATLDGGAITSNANDAQVVFTESAVGANPLFQFEDTRGDVVMGGFFINLLNQLKDPRRTVFAAEVKGGGWKGAGAGVAEEGPDASRFGKFYASSSSPVPLLSFVEVKFMEAEAAFKTDAKERAANAYNDAVKASIAKFGLKDDAYIAANAAETAASITLEKIMTQKYIGLYTSPETFNDWRRTGLPNLLPARGQSRMARRWPLAQDERVYNNANAQPYLNKTVFDRVFWDK